MAKETSPLNVAIVGGGISGLLLAIALLKKCPHIHVTVYESASAFGEIGAGVGFEPVMVRTMELIDPRIAATFEKCTKGNTVTEPPRWFTVRIGDERKKDVQLGEEIFVMPARRGPRGGLHRAHFLDELVKLVPDGIARFGKRLQNITEAEDGSGDAVLHFADGSMAQHNAVLGCDGIKSRTRSIILGDSETSTAVFSGKYAYRGLLPMTKAVEILGEVTPKTPQMYMGYHGHVLTFPIANGTLFNVVAFASRQTWDNSEWVVQTSHEDMLDDYKHWIPPVREIIGSLQKPDIWALFDHPPAPTYYSTKPLVCLVGDAAHASTPHQGAGAGMGVEDVYILGELLSRCDAKSDIAKAFQAYDAVRRPRSQKLVKTSREAGMLWDLEGEGVGDDLETHQQNALSRMDWVWDYNILDDLARAMEIMETGRNVETL